MNLECNHNTYTFGKATLCDVQFLVTEAMVHHQCSHAMVTVTIRHYKSLLVMNFECHYNTYTFGKATFGGVQCLVTEDMVHHHYSYEMVTIAILHYKSLLVMNLYVTQHLYF